MSETANPKHAPASNGHQAPTLTPDQIQAISRALADPRRFEILQQIAGSDSLLCGQLDAQHCISAATISHHLRELQETGLVEAERSGRQICLRLRRPVWNAYLTHLQQL